MSQVFEFFQDVVKSCNVFTSPVNLRYKLDPDYNTVAGGFVSIILVILLVSVFFNAWITLLSKQDISSTTEVIREFDPSYFQINSDKFMFAIGVSGINLTDSSQKKYFDLSMKKVEMIKTQTNRIVSTPFALEPCTVSHWESFGQDFVQTFHRQRLSGFLCAPKNTLIEIGGKWTSQKFSYLQISFDRCNGKSDCQSQAEMDAWIASNTAFFFNFFYTNTLLNPDQKGPISTILEDKDFTMFSPNLATFTNLYLGEYDMETDESIFPWTEKKVDNGFIVNRAEKETLNFVPTSRDAYCQLFLRKSNVKLQIERKFRKLDDMLSYIGGLFGIIAVAIGIVMNYYGQCSFELQMCQKIFDYQNKKQNKDAIKIDIEPAPLQQTNSENSCPNNSIEDQNLDVIEPKDFGFWDFFSHLLIYPPLKKIFNIKWQRMEIYEQSLEEMRYKLDISQVMEKLTFYDRSINALFDESQLKLLYLQEKINFQEVRDERDMLSMREGIVSNLFDQAQNSSETTDQPSITECKKPLQEIAQRKSQRIQSWIGNQANANLLQKLGKVRPSISQKPEEAGLPSEIKSALKKLDAKIEGGDVVSTRIYNGLQFELLQIFEKSKMNKNNYSVTMKKLKKIKTKKSVFEERESVKQKVGKQNLAEYVAEPSLTSINFIK